MLRLLELAIDTVPRVLGLTDRDPNSPTAGCADRAYWHYRLLDIANARYQEAGLLFALAFATEDAANPFAGRTKMAEWARLAWRFWLERRNRDGSVVEVYPNERSFCGTAFSAAAFVQTAALLGGADAWKTELAAARQTMVWLAANANPDVANQMAASWLALAGYARLTGDAAVRAAATERRAQVLAGQQADGTWPEYGGLDVGYQTITLSSLASVLDLNPEDDDLRSALKQGEKAIASRIAADGAVNAATNSRGTQYLYPHAMAALESGLLLRLLAGLDGRTVLRPSWMDDRYCIALATDYLLAYRRGAHRC